MCSIIKNEITMAYQNAEEPHNFPIDNNKMLWQIYGHDESPWDCVNGVAWCFFCDGSSSPSP